MERFYMSCKEIKLKIIMRISNNKIKEIVKKENLSLAY